MSDTPRTDAFGIIPSSPSTGLQIGADWAAFSCTLERELVETRSEIGRLRERLAEAVKALRAGECDCTVETMTQCGRCQFLAKHEEDKL